MANELQFIYETKDKTLYFALRNLSGQMWNTSGTPNWEARTVANWTDYDIALSETPASSFLYVGTIPAISGNMAAGWMWADIYEQAGASPAIADDTLVGQMLGYWGGSTFRLYDPSTGDSFARLGAPAGASVSADIAAVKTDTGNLVARITSTLFDGITSLAKWLRLLARKDAGDATAKSELNTGGGAYDETTDSTEAIRDRGDQAWLTGSGATASASYTTENWTRTVGDDDGGAGSDTTTVNGTYFATGETAAGTYLEVDAVFSITDGETAVSLDVWGFYAGGGSHYIEVRAYNYTDSTWEPIGVIGLGTAVQKYSFGLAPGNTNPTTDQVAIKFIHQGGSGVGTHVFNVDKAEVNTAIPVVSLNAADIVDEWESQSQLDPTGFHVNVKEVNGTAQTANDNAADINTLVSRIVGTLAAGTHNAQSGDAYAYLGTNLGLLGANATEAGGTGDHLTAVAPAATALSTATWTAEKAGFLDAAISSRGTGVALDASGIRSAVGLAAANLDTQIGTLATAANLAAAKTLIDRIIVPVAGTTSGAGTGTEIFTYGGITMTSTVNEDGERATVEWGTV